MSAVAEILSVVLALIAACSNAASNVIQRATNREESDVQTLSLQLVRDLLHRPLWFAGLGAVVLSFLLQASALHFGPLARVEPLLVFELPLTFVGAAMFLGARLGAREWTAALVMTVGLAALVFFLHTSGHHGHVSAAVWAVGLGICEGIVTVLVIAGRRTTGDPRAALYGAATGIQFGVTAALMAGAVHLLGGGIGSLFSAWQTYVMVVSGVFALFLVQNALQSGKIVAAQPGITLLDPFVAIVWGVFAFHEKATNNTVYLIIAALGGVAMVAGAILLSRSPVLQHGGDRSGSSSDEGWIVKHEEALSG
ncbi:MAG: DMT family transporter [Acidimicrobiales bacterium]